MATITNQPGQSWREAAIERSEGITDAWEVTKTYAGRLAEWILFACMIGCILEVLVAVPLWLSNTILGVQAVTLDIGGFALSSMADQARANGDEQAARKADVTGKFLIGIVILTLALITVGLLYTPAKSYTDGAEKVLILIRVVMTVVYGHVIHSLRRTSAAALNPTQVASLEQVMHDRITALTEQSHHHLQGVRTEIIREVQTILRDIPVLVQDQVQNFLTDQVQSGHYAEHATAIQELAVSLQEVKREMRTTITEVRTVTRQGGPKGGAKEPLKLVRAPLVEADPAPQSASNGQGANSSEGVQERVQRFITEQLTKGCKPTLGEIQEGCNVSKHTAIKYRRVLLGDDESEEAINQ